MRKQLGVGVGEEEEEDASSISSVGGDFLFETKEEAKWWFRGAYKVVFATTLFAAISLIWLYRITNFTTCWPWIALSVSEIAFGLYWIFTQSVRCRIPFHFPFKHKLFHRNGKEKLPGVDIFVCTADARLEPPCMVVNTVLAAMSFNYPPNKLAVYLSDDGGSELTFYALIKASIFAKHWLPFCRKFNVEPMSPHAYFFAPQTHSNTTTHQYAKQYSSIKKLYEEMKRDIESAVAEGKVPEGARNQHKGFSEWNPKTTKQDHQAIVQIIIDGRDRNAVDEDGIELPTVVYMAREKRPNFPHHFKAGAMNALIRVSSEISNAPFILNLDCDMYPSNADIIQETLCFFMDEARGHDIAYVQFPQNYDNLTTNDHYANINHATNMFELAGIGGYGAALYCGTGCFHRRESISGTHLKDYRAKREQGIIINKNLQRDQDNRTVDELNEASKALATCSYEQGTLWGKEMGLVYGIPVEDIATGLAITCRGWKSIYYNPEKTAFLGVAPTSLDVALVQYKRWSEGMFQVFFSKHCPFIYGHGKMSFGVQMGYCVYLLWAPLSLPTLCYVLLPPISLLHAIPLFPQLTSPWFIPFAYAFLGTNIYSLCEAWSCGSTTKAWWNLQRMKLIRRTTSFFFAFIDTITKQLGLSETKFAITDKAVTEDAQKRYEQELIDFGGTSSIMLTILVTVALLNLFVLIGGIMRILVMMDHHHLELLMMQIMLSALIVVINLPVYEAIVIRSDKGCISSLVTINSILLASFLCFLAK